MQAMLLLPPNGSGSTGKRTDIINLVHGVDNFEDENADDDITSALDVHSTIHDDVLHSHQAVVNYNRHGNDNDVYVFYGGQ